MAQNSLDDRAAQSEAFKVQIKGLVESFADDSETLEEATTLAHLTIQRLMRSVIWAVDVQVTDKQSWRKAWSDLESERSVAILLGSLLRRQYPELYDSIGEALRVTGYTNLFVAELLKEKLVDATDDTVCKTYFAKSPATGLIKIGRSISPEARIKNLKTGAGSNLETLGILDSDREKELHNLFADLRVQGEWFKDDGRISDFLGETCAA